MVNLYNHYNCCCTCFVLLLLSQFNIQNVISFRYSSYNSIYSRRINNNNRSFIQILPTNRIHHLHDHQPRSSSIRIPLLSSSSSLLLLSSFDSQNTNGDISSNDESTNNNEQQSKKMNQLRRRMNHIMNTMKTKLYTIMTRLRTIQMIYTTKFKSLSKRSKFILSLQFVLLFGIFSSIMSTTSSTTSKNYYYNGVPYSKKQPIEVSYSSFLDLIEQKAIMNSNTNTPTTTSTTTTTSTSTIDSSQPIIPKIDQVRIGTDRISYRLVYNNNNQNNQYQNSIPSQSTTTTSTSSAITSSTSTTNTKDMTGIPSTTSSTITTLRNPLRIRNKQKQLQQSQSQQNYYIPAYTRKVMASSDLIQQLRMNDISFAAASISRTTSTITIAARTVLIGFYLLILYRLYKTISNSGINGGSNKNDSIGKLANQKNKKNIFNNNNDTNQISKTSFDEIQGIDHAKLEVMELVDVLRNPMKYNILGARAPKGLLLVGPPGTGKTMLARATAACTGIPLLYCTGSDFVEMFVGRGAARVRQLFDRASKIAPCIIFIDELDALGKSRDFNSFGSNNNNFPGMMSSRSNDEAEQTLNQLLACMDGLDSSRQVVVLAATNRKEVLDPALIRPGRFDRIVQLELPDAKGREQILRIHASKLPGFTEGTGLDVDRPNALGKGNTVDLSAIAAITEGWSGAELEYLVNEAAIRAVRRISTALQQQQGDGTNCNNNFVGSMENKVPHVEARDFEESLRNFYETRKGKGGTPSMNDILKNVWK